MAPPPVEVSRAAGGTRRQLRGVGGRTLLAAADRLPLPTGDIKIEARCLILKKVDSQQRVNNVSFTHAKAV